MQSPIKLAEAKNTGHMHSDDTSEQFRAQLVLRHTIYFSPCYQYKCKNRNKGGTHYHWPLVNVSTFIPMG